MSRHLTTADLLALPDDGRRRWLIDGVLWEQRDRFRGQAHAQAVANTAAELNRWRLSRPAPRGSVVCGGCGVRLPGGDRDTTVGVDVAYLSPDLLSRQTGELVEGTPTLVAEVLSADDRSEELAALLTAYLRAGVPLVWVVDPDEREVRIYPLGGRPSLATEADELTGGDVLPGFRVPVARLFE